MVTSNSNYLITKHKSPVQRLRKKRSNDGINLRPAKQNSSLLYQSKSSNREISSSTNRMFGIKPEPEPLSKSYSNKLFDYLYSDGILRRRDKMTSEQMHKQE